MEFTQVALPSSSTLYVVPHATYTHAFVACGKTMGQDIVFVVENSESIHDATSFGHVKTFMQNILTDGTTGGSARYAIRTYDRDANTALAMSFSTQATTSTFITNNLGIGAVETTPSDERNRLS